MSESRARNSVRNMTFALVEQLVQNIMSFICRTVFIYCLGKTYLGFSGLFSDVFALLSLAELGVGTAITYSMYKPAARKDYKELTALLNEFKKIYTWIGAGITVVGLSLTPFLKYIVSDIPDMPELPCIYILYLLNTTVGYFFSYKRSILITDQKTYITSIVYMAMTTTQYILQIVIILLFRNFILYLTIQIICTTGSNVLISGYVDKKYPQLKEYKSEKLPTETRKGIYDNVKAMFLSKISSAVVSSTSNLLISAFVSTITLGLYSNYTLFVNLFRTISTKLFEGLYGSVGNLIAKERLEKVYDIFKKLWFVNFWLVSLFAVALFTLINPFITLWIGDEYLLGTATVALVCVNLYMRFIRNTFITFTDTFGLFKEFKIKCVCEAIINLVVSVLLVVWLELGINGVLLGTFISNLVTNFWYEPYVLFKKKFGVSLLVYFGLFFKYVCLTIIAIGGCTVIYNFFIIMNGWIGFVLKGLGCVLFINGFYIIMFWRTAEFKYFLEMLNAKLKTRR